MSEPDLQALMALRVQGVGDAHRLACALSRDLAQAEQTGAALVEAGLAQERTLGRTSGLALTPEGIRACDEALEAEGLRADAELLSLYDRFCVLDAKLKRICTDWQVRRHGPIETPNDHADPDYDHAVIERLREHHDRVTALLRRIIERAGRFAAYQSRLDACVVGVGEGDRQAFTGVMRESYHTVWFELHQDLIVTLGVERHE